MEISILISKETFYCESSIYCHTGTSYHMIVQICEGMISVSHVLLLLL
jgi:hypothetical protein